MNGLNRKFYIYRIFNKITKDFYIGSTFNFKRRSTEHKRNLRKNIHHSVILQKAYNKHKLRNFKFEIIKIGFGLENKLEIEQKYLEKNPKYNVSKNALAPMTGRKHSKSTLKKFKKRKVLKGKDHPYYGIKFSKERIRRMSKPRIGLKRTEKTKRKMSQTAKRLNSISRIDRSKGYKPVKDSNGNMFKNMVECAKFWKISPATVCDILKGRHHQTKQKIQFKYSNDNTPFINPQKIRDSIKLKRLDKKIIKLVKKVKKDILNNVEKRFTLKKLKINRHFYDKIKNGESYRYV